MIQENDWLCWKRDSIVPIKFEWDVSLIQNSAKLPERYTDKTADVKTNKLHNYLCNSVV